MGVLVAGGLTGLLNQSSAQVIDSSLKFNDDSSNVLNRTPSAAGNRKTWTWSGWVKRTTLGTEGGIFSTYAGAHPNTSLFWESEALKFHDYTGSYNIRLGTSAVFRDPSAWYHIVLAYNSTESTASDRAKLYVNGTLQTLSGTTVPSNFETDWNSTTEHNIGRFAAYFDGSMSQCYFIDGQALGPGYFGFTDPLTNTWRPKKFRAEGTTINDGTTWSSYGDGNAASSYEWTHAFDGSFGANDYVTGTATYTTITFPEAIQAENIYLFLGTGTTAGLKINGVQITDVVGAYNNSARYKVGSNGEGNFLKTISLYNSGTQWSILYAIEVGGVLMRDGITQNLAFGTNGFYLPMDNDDFHIDKSGNGNNWTKQNFSGTFNDPDVLKDSPSGAVSGGRAQTGITTTSSAPSNYATFNPLIKPSGGDSQGSGGSLSDGNLTIKSGGSTGNYRLASCSPSIPLTGKYYFEFTTISAIHTDNNTIGIFNPASPVYSSGDYARINPSFSGSFTTTKKRSGTATNLAGSAGDFSGGDVVNIAIDSDKRSIWFGKNGVYYEGNPSSGTGASYTNLTTGVEYAVRSFVYNSGGTQAEGRINFGQKPFKYAPPQGFLPLNSASATPETVITRPNQFVGTTLYTGNNGTQNINAGLKPDFVWIKNRSSSATDGNHLLFDTIRGVQNAIYSNLVDDQDTLTNSLTSFNLDGFTVGGPGASGNIDSQNYVAWTWKAGGNKNTFNVDDVGYASAAAAGLGASGNSWDSDPTGASVGTKQGFSIIKHTGTGSAGTLPHGLTQKPDFYISKPVNTSGNWVVYTDLLDGSLDYLYLNTTDAKGNSGQSLPTSEVFSYGYTANEYIHYLWHDVPGLQKFGSYTGGGSSYPFIELGFSPAILMIKNASTGGTHYDWKIIDSTRNPFNLGADNADSKNVLFPNLSDAENKGGSPWAQCDFLSNGFRMNDQSVTVNNSGSTYIYAAWAEAPTFNLYGGQSNAR